MAESACLRGGESVADAPGPDAWPTACQVTALQKRTITPALMIQARLTPATPPPFATFDVPCFPQKPIAKTAQ
jgi:hypothetical protein